MNVTEKVTEMNRLIMQNSPREKFDKFYDKNATKQENDGPEIPRSKSNEEADKMFANVKSAEYKVVSTLSGDDLSMTEWAIKFTMKDGKEMPLNEVAVQKWKNGKIIKERYYHPEMKM